MIHYLLKYWYAQVSSNVAYSSPNAKEKFCIESKKLISHKRISYSFVKELTARNYTVSEENMSLDRVSKWFHCWI